MKRKSFLLLTLIFGFGVLLRTTHGQNAPAQLPPRQALVLAVEGKAEVSLDGRKFSKVKAGQALK
jgi:hypothetical protein